MAIEKQSDLILDGPTTVKAVLFFLLASVSTATPLVGVYPFHNAQTTPSGDFWIGSIPNWPSDPIFISRSVFPPTQYYAFNLNLLGSFDGYPAAEVGFFTLNSGQLVRFLALEPVDPPPSPEPVPEPHSALLISAGVTSILLAASQRSRRGFRTR